MRYWCLLCGIIAMLLYGAPAYAQSGSISASACSDFDSNGKCTLTLSWSTSGVSAAEVWVFPAVGNSAKLFSGTQGNQVLNWIQALPQQYTFRLYRTVNGSRGTELNSTNVAVSSTLTLHVTPFTEQVLNYGDLMRFTITVRRPNGGLMSGATVSILDTLYGGGGRLETVITGSNGQATYEYPITTLVAAKRYTLQFGPATKAGWNPSTSLEQRDVVVLSPPKFLQLAVQPEGNRNAKPGDLVSYTITLTDNNNNRIANASVPIFNPLAGNTSVTTDSNSTALYSFTVSNSAQPGTHTISFGAVNVTGYISSSIVQRNIIVGSALTMEVHPSENQTVLPGGSITYTITVRDGNNNLISGANVTISNPFTHFNDNVTTDGTGRASYLLSVPNGQGASNYTVTFVRATKSGYTDSVSVSRILVVSNIIPPTVVLSLMGQNQMVGNGGTLNLTAPSGSSVNVSFSASGSSQGSGTFKSYEWRNNNVVISNQPSFTRDINAQNNAITLAITNSYDRTATASATIILTTAPPEQPTIDSITPDPITLSTTTVLTVNGSKFQSGFTASVTTPGGNYPISSTKLNFVNSGQVKVEVNMGGATGYTAYLNITNPGGKTATKSFQVILDPGNAPSITGILPTQVTYNVPTTLVVNGNYFQPGFTASVASPGRTDTIASEGLSFINTNQVQVQVLMKGSPPYTAELTITNPNGKNAKSTFQVIKPNTIPSPVFNIQPPSGVIGTKFTNTGRNFTPLGEVRIKVKWANGAVVDGIVKRADGSGYFSYDYTSQPGDPLGKHTLEVTDVTSGQTVSAQEEFLGTSASDALSVTNATLQAKANSVTKIKWRIKNTGTTTWNTNYKLVFVSSSISQNLSTQGSSAYTFPATFTPGQEGDLPLDMKVPATKGTYFSYWQLQNAQGQVFGAQFYAQITVTESSKSNVKNGNPSGNSSGDSPQTNSKTESDPVNTANGNYIYDREDLRVPGRGMDFVFSRAYNSTDSTSSTLGNGWSHSFHLSLSDTNTNNPVVRYSDGKVLEYELGAVGNYVPRIPGFYDTLVKNLDGSWTLRKPDQRNYNFDLGGKLVSIQDRNNNLISLGYDSENKLQNATDTVGRKFTFAYSGQRLSTLTDPISRTLQFTYDSAGNLISFKDANGNTIQYEYDANSRVARIVDGRQKNLLVNEYDAEGRVKSQTNGRGFKWSFSYDSTGRVTTIIDPLGKVIKDQHDELFNLDNTTNRLQQNTSIGYDTNGNPSQTQDLKGSVYGFSYDTRGNLTSVVSPNQTTRQIEYDLKNNPMKVTDELGRQTTMEYDPKGNLKMLKDALNQAAMITYNSFGQPETITNPSGNQIKLEYDNQGNLKKVTEALNNTTSYEYDGVGRRTKVTNGRGKSTSIFYDNNDNVVNVVTPLGTVIAYNYDQNNNLVTIRDARAITTAYTYNENNLLIKERDDSGKFIEHTYDQLDRRISTKDKRGNVTEFGYDDEGHLITVKDQNGNITRYEYDANGNRTKLIDPIGQVTEFTYDSLNRLTKIKDPLGSLIERKYDAAGQLIEELDQRGLLTKFTYDAVGNLVRVDDASGGKVIYAYDKNRNRISVTDPNNNTSLTTFDKLNRVETTADPLNNKYTYTYDEVGNRKTRMDAKQQLTKYDYDDNNRLATITYPDNKTVKFKYDEDGNVIEMTDSLGVTKYVYDGLNRVISYTDAYGKTIGYQYDESGNVKVLIYPDGKQVTYEYDKGNRMASVTDWLGKKTSYEYDGRNLVTKVTNGNGTTAKYTYDNAGRLTMLVNAKSDGMVMSSYTYVLDKNGNRLSATIQEPLPLQVTTPPQNAAFDNANRISRAGASTFTFDANGNMTSKITGGVTTVFNYDFEDRLITVGGATQYSYNGAGIRLERRVASKTTRFVVDTNYELPQVICELDESGAITSSFIYGLGLVSKIGSDAKLYNYHYDPIGSTVAISDDKQTVNTKYSYDAFGNLTVKVEAEPNPFKFVGKNGLMDEENGLVYVRARYYQPALGRFLTQDPSNNGSINSQSINQYIYALNNPTLLFDINGLSAWSSISNFTTNTFNKADKIITNSVNYTTQKVNEFSNTRFGVGVKGGLQVIEGIGKVNAGVGLLVSTVPQGAAAPATGGVTAVTAIASAGAGTYLFASGTINIAEGIANIGKAIKGETKAFSLNEAISSAQFGTKVPAQAYDCSKTAIKNVFKSDVVGLLDACSEYYQEQIRPEVEASGGILHYALFPRKAISK